MPSTYNSDLWKFFQHVEVLHVTPNASRDDMQPFIEWVWTKNVKVPKDCINKTAFRRSNATFSCQNYQWPVRRYILAQYSGYQKFKSDWGYWYGWLGDEFKISYAYRMHDRYARYNECLEQNYPHLHLGAKRNFNASAGIVISPWVLSHLGAPQNRLTADHTLKSRRPKRFADGLVPKKPRLEHPDITDIHVRLDILSHYAHGGTDLELWEHLEEGTLPACPEREYMH